MKLSLLLLFTSIFLLQANESYSQRTKMTLDLQDVPVEELIDVIENKSEYRFLYLIEDVDLQRKVSVRAKNKRVEFILDAVFKGTNTQYSIEDRQISLTRASVSETAKKVVPVKVLQVSVTGTVTDESGAPLPGANIIEKGTSNGTQTDFDGNFSITVSNENATLVVSYIGFAAKEIPLNGQTSISVSLLEDTSGLDEVVVIGYGTLSRSKVLGAVSSVKSEDISQLPVGGVDQSIAGRVPGVQIVSSGAPGSASQIRVRGVGTITAGRSPLIVVDGYPLTEGSDLNAINPLDIESIQVLKDAASTSIYGSRGANGVIFVTTKSAASEEPTFNFDTYTGFQSVLNPIKLLDAYQFAQMVKEARDWGYVSADPTNRSENDDTATRLANGASPRNLIPANIDRYLAGTPGLTNNDWLDDVFRDGAIQNHNLSVSGRSGKTKWFVSGGYFNQEGLIIGSDFERFTARINLETQLSDAVKFGINMTPSVSNQNSVVEGWTDGPMQQAILSEPFFTPYNDEGELNISQQIRWHNNGGTDGALVENPVAIALRRKNELNKFRLFGNSFVEVNILNGLTFKTLFGGDFDFSVREEFRPSTIGRYRVDVTATVPSASERTRTRKNWITENTLTYDKTFGKHDLNLLAGYSYQKERFDNIRVEAPVLESDDIPNVAGSPETISDKDVSEWVLISYFSRLQYSFDSKYLLSASIRRDGSSRFGDNNKFGIFPSISGGWVVSNEGFFPEKSFISNLKLRYSWGKTGNNQIGDYGSIAVLRQLNGILDDGLAGGQIPDTAPNADLSWETSITNNAGIDISFFDNKLSLSADYFTSTTEDMLLNVPVPQQSGFDTSLQNIGSMENTGLELALSVSDINLGGVKWSSSVNFSKVENKVLQLAPGQDQIIAGGTNITQIGRPIGEFYGFVVDGIYKSQAEIDASPQSGTDVKVGDWRIIDVDGNGLINDEDRTVIGTALPDFTYGFNNRFAYKNFDLNVFIDGVEGVDVLSRTVRNFTNGQGFSNQLAWYFENRWHPQNNPNGTLARPDYTQSSERLRANVSSAFLEDGSFLRVRNITLGYNMPTDIISGIGLKRLRVYATATNPFLITDFKGFNPEQSRSNPLDPSDTEGSYPLNRTLVLGLNVSF
ncbi:MULTISPECIES: TonB-dependent receptor [unclassified Croceitalea]|uniref:TonB-dependent receptor n=1 Tax=unclassified Croceitalea TaxID=2632280 RepID=UPI0030DCC7D9